MPWRIFPTAVAIHFGGAIQTGIIIEPIMFGEFQFVYNFISKEFDVLQVNTDGSDSFFHIGTTGLVGVNVYGGITTYRGASTNDVLEGKALSLGADGSIDAIGKFGISKEKGYAVQQDTYFQPYWDDYTKMPITFSQTNITYGGNIFPNGIDGGLFGGYSFAKLKR